MSVLSTDLCHILDLTRESWEDLRGKRLFMTGGTGFFGSHLLESFAFANKELNLNASVLVLTRDIKNFKKTAPHLVKNSAIKFHLGDVKDFNFPDGEFSHIIHAAATSAVETFNREDHLAKFDTLVGGTRHVLDFAVHCKAQKFLFTSSGAAYGKQPADMTHISEEYLGAPNPPDPNSAWGEGKRVAEFLCGYYSNKYGIETKIVRCFSFVGPYLPIDIHYAIGNFIRDALKGGPIIVSGDGSPVRSYLYSSDLVVWLWTILFKGKTRRIYNIGSGESITIAELANVVAQSLGPNIEVKIEKTPDHNKVLERYIPDISLVKKELGLVQTIDLKTAIKKTAEHIQKNNKLYH
ncbi:NAD-dependent epimerase/dehydratase family protein [Candidatus Microgenomates bacterium]|nr:NAD-dependent epimerase/dehydratase family protein [Candidatus Microgenomates bacterium]